MNQLCARLVDLDISRITEQTAILLYLYVAHLDADPSPGRRIEVYESLALASVMGFLPHMCAHCHIVHPYKDDFRGRQKGTLRRTLGHPPTSSDDWELDLIVTPLDGKRALQKGMQTGSITAIGCGPRGSFLAQPKRADKTDRAYLVVTGRHRLIQTLLDNPPPASAASDWLRDALPLLRSAKPDRPFLCCATAANDGDYVDRRILPLLNQFTRPRVFSGSALAAAIPVFIDRLHTDLFVGIMRPHHAILAAMAAVSTDHSLLAVPLRNLIRSPREDWHVDADRKILSANELVPKASEHDMSLWITGISDNLICRGVSFENRRHLWTQSIGMRTKSKAFRDIRHRHDLRSKPFRLDVERLPRMRDRIREALITMSARFELHYEGPPESRKR